MKRPVACVGLLMPNVLGGALLWGAVRRVQVPEGGISPDVTLDRAGVVYLVFGHDENAYFTMSKDGGKTFSTALRLNKKQHTVLVGHERGPKIALGKAAALHVVWMNTRSTELDYVRSLRGKTGFSAARNLLVGGKNLDGATVAADEQGTVLVTWLDSRLPQDAGNPLSLPVFYSLSRDSGKTFGRNQELQSDVPLRACSCCALKAVDLRGGFDIAFRGAYHDVRDPFLARVSVKGRDATARTKRIADQEWEFDACPMSGSFVSKGGPPHDLWATWMSNGRIYCARSTDGGQDFAKARSVTSAAEAVQQNHPIVLVNASGQILLAWEAGGRIRWQVTDPVGKITDSDDAGILPGNSKATGFVDQRADFCLVF